MKGSSGNLRVTKIFELASELELVLKAEQEGTKEKADAIIMELAEIMQKLL
jgi:HPt (histidine-containing phosphotransfer) domain-containing protein